MIILHDDDYDDDDKNLVVNRMMMITHIHKHKHTHYKLLSKTILENFSLLIFFLHILKKKFNLISK